MGQKPHIRNEEVAAQIVELSGRGMTQDDISAFLNATRNDDQGYSVDTLDRHYRRELDAGLLTMKGKLLASANDRALGKNVPEGVTKDVAYREQGRSLEWLLSAVHKVSPKHGINLGGPDGEKLDLDLSLLSDEQLDQLERIYSTLAVAGTDARGA